MRDVDFREVSPVLGHVVANHWTRNGKWPDLWSYWKWPQSCFSFCGCFPPLPPQHPFSFLTCPLCAQLDFLGTRPHSETASFNLHVSILPGCLAVPWTCWDRSKAEPGVSLRQSSWLVAEMCPLPCCYRRWNLLRLCRVHALGSCFGVNVGWTFTLSGGAGLEGAAAFRIGAGREWGSRGSFLRIPLGPPVGLNTGQWIKSGSLDAQYGLCLVFLCLSVLSSC